MMQRLSALFLVLAVSAAPHAPSLAAPTATARIKVEYTQTGLTDRRTFGTNVLYWIDDDRSLASGALAERLRTMGVGMLRFPGGEAADNYDWRTNSVDYPAIYPGQPSADSPNLRTNSAEFLTLSGAVGATANFVVNVEGAWNEGSPAYLAEYLDRAAAWVREAGAQVQYWEIGNEAYHCGGRHPLTAEEYAQSLIEFSRAMKAAAPEISVRIGAIGPFDYDDPGCMDQLSPEARAGYRSLSYAERNELEGPNFADRLNATYGGTPETPAPWWPTVARIAGAHFDWVVLHRYDNTRVVNGAINYRGTLRIGETVNNIRSTVQYYRPGPVEIGVTEWNIGSAASSKISALDRAVVIGEQMLQYQKAGANLMNLWPLRMRSVPSLVNFTSYAPSSIGVVFEALSKEIQPVRVKQTLQNAGNLETLVTAAPDGATTTLFVVNRGSGAQNLSLEGVSGVPIRSETLVASTVAPFVAWQTVATKAIASGFSTSVPARSFSVLVFRR